MVLQPYISENPDIAQGVMLWAAHLIDTGSLAHYPTPVMHLSGDLDGMVEITTIATLFRYFLLHVIAFYTTIISYIRKLVKNNYHNHSSLIVYIL